MLKKSYEKFEGHSQEFLSHQLFSSILYHEIENIIFYL